jgi:hypothetical protein
MKQLERLKLIYGLLSHSPQTIDSIQNALQALGTVVSNRQLYRDLDDVGNYFLRAEEKLELKNQEFNKKLYVINRNNGASTINNFDIDTYFINKLVIPAGIAIGRKSSLDKFRDIFANHLNSSKVENNASWDGLSMLNTHFNEIVFDQQFQDKFNQILWSVSNHRAIEIIACKGDSVSMYKSISFPFLFLAMKIIYHRGSFFVAGMVDGSRKCLVLDLYQITTFKLSNQTFPFKKEMAVLDKNLQGRFGVSQNINDEIYEVILDFASLTGEFVQAHTWHHTQRFEMLPNSNVRMYLNCGINRELIGWVYMWMGHVKIISPDVLKEYHHEQLESIHVAYNSEVLTYNDFRQPD